MRNGIASAEVRTIFVSDVHLGSAYCQPKPLIDLLRSTQPEALYLVGDFCDGWLLRRNWRWPGEYVALIETISDLSRSGTQVIYLLGNHDRCLHRWTSEWSGFEVAEKRIHTCRDGRRLLVIHGDQFDGTQRRRFRYAAQVSAVIHERILGGSRMADSVLTPLGLRQTKLANALTRPLKSIAHSFGHFWIRAKELAVANGCDGVLCGHTHTPILRESNNFSFANTGDWLEHCSAILETYSGQLELWMGESSNWNSTARRHSVIPAKAAVPTFA